MFTYWGRVMKNSIDFNELLTLFEEMSDCIDFYEKVGKDNAVFKIRMADGKTINFCVPRYCVSHLLGVNIDYLSSTGLFNNKASYFLLKEMLKNGNRIYYDLNAGIIDYDRLFSKHVVNKVANFKNNIMIDVKNSELVCEYSKERAYIDSDFSFDFDYVLTKKNGESYSLLGLKNRGSYYVPMTSQFFATKNLLDEKLSKIVRNQKITYINGVYFPNGNKFFLRDEFKEGRVRTLSQYSKNGAILDVSGDYLHCLEHSNSVRNCGGKIDYSVASFIIECLDSCKIIDFDNFDFNSKNIDSNLFAVISKVNDLLLKTVDLNDCNFSFSELVALREKCSLYKERVCNLEAKVTSQEEELENKNNMISSLSGENEELRDITNEAIKILTRKSRLME